MITVGRFVITTTLVLFSALLMNIQAQTPPIEVTTDNDRSQFYTQGHAMHIEVFSPSGELIFESDSVAGKPVAWQMVNDKGERVADGVYLATIAVTDFSGKRRKRIEQIIVNHETRPKEVLSAHASISRAVVGPIKADASVQTVVLHDATLTGDGTAASPLSVAVPLSFNGDSLSPILSVTNRGNGPAISATGPINTTTQYNIGSERVLFGNAFNTFAGVGAGKNTTGLRNSFFGVNAGLANAGGLENSFFGMSAGFANTTGSNNAFFGTFAGQANGKGDANSFFGSTAGHSNTWGSRNAFFGADAGSANTIADNNSFFGSLAGASNTTGASNSFFGTFAGQANVNGKENSFFGMNAGLANENGANNSFSGKDAGRANKSGFDNSFFGRTAGHSNITGAGNSFFGRDAGFLNASGARDTFVGFRAGAGNITGNDNTYIGSNAGGSDALTNATAIGANALVMQANSLVLGSRSGINGATADTNVGIGTTTPQSTLHVATGYVQLPFVTTPPAAGDCTAKTAGRMVVFANGTSDARLYICDSVRSAAGNQPGWVIK